MRIALVSPYSWTYPGGVTRHIEALRHELDALGDDVRDLAPVDPPDRWSVRRHRGAVPQERELPDWLIPLGRTMGFPANGAVSNLTMPNAPFVSALRRELREGGYDVVHLHEPVVPCVGWDTLMTCGVPMVGTFHCYSNNAVSNGIAVAIGARRRLNRLKVRIAVSEAAAWTGERFYGGAARRALLRRPLPRDPQRRGSRRDAAGRPGRVGHRAAAAAHRVRRPGRRAQGPSRAAARLR